MSDLVEIRDLHISYETARGIVYALDGVDLTVYPSQILGIVGESGSGKSTLGMAIGRLLPSNSHRTSGDLFVNGQSIFDIGDEEIRLLRQESLGFVFQNPISTLDPTMRVGRQIRLVLNGPASDDSVYELLGRVGLPDVKRVARSYPYQLSGGMAQRVVIAMAISRHPSLLIADEPTASLDASVREQILKLLLSVREETGVAIVLLSHELGLVAKYCDTIAVMYGGRLVETGSNVSVFRRPGHPYTKALLEAAPGNERPGDWLEAIPGVPPVLQSSAQGCVFEPRCKFAHETCRTVRPVLRPIENRMVACHRAEEVLKIEPTAAATHGRIA
ncbi:ABC transporter ATP-binding protein [Mesorhizobium australicum]|uniref:Nickel import system ATP-binding protein NikD n=1 Tax=Mesorhizobium australicum TaxID=536018 RepID=A0A1X7MPS2_9HYPH|nr:ABC transporter ATP-binding protein [Mesorhizobium australicum]SMH26695.1 oligopeptide transport system ATP-binding protein [Mesorhizobium australicum]